MKANVHQSAHEVLFKQFQEVCGIENVFDDADVLERYGHDKTLDLHYDFDFLVCPKYVEQVSGILKICNDNEISVTPRGGGTGVTGGALPAKRGLVLSFERMNEIIAINTIDGYVEAESGVVTSELAKAVERVGFCIPVIPSSADACFIGGNVAENAGSIQSCKFGSTRDYILNLQIVLASGEVFWTGANVSKNSTGLNLTKLLVGSEGTLAVITKVVYRIIRKPKHCMTLLCAFPNLDSAYEAIKRLKLAPFVPSGVELITSKAFAFTRNVTRLPYPNCDQLDLTQLIIEYSEERDESLTVSLDYVNASFLDLTDCPILIGNTAKENFKLTRLRYDIGVALESQDRYYRDIDVCVPLSRLLDYIKYVQDLSTMYNVEIIIFGHALDANMHTMIFFDKNVSVVNAKIDELIHKIYSYAVSSGGVVSGEHGIGILQKEFMRVQYDVQHLAIMKGIKDTFDPKGILNPEKMYVL